MKLLLKLSYIGTGYCGFQFQKNGLTVQSVITECAARVFGFPCSVTGCSRTDAGVHARGFVCSVEPKDRTESEGDWLHIPVEKIHRAFAQILPRDISVIASAAVSDSFHPRYSAVGKQYTYRIWDAPWEDPFEYKRSMKSIFRISSEALVGMNKAAELFCGRHDFTSFMASGSKITDPHRRVFDARVTRESGGAVAFTVSADGFLYNMVRIMAGTLLAVAAGRLQPEDIPGIIESRDRKAAGATAPAWGLYLDRVFYNENINWLST